MDGRFYLCFLLAALKGGVGRTCLFLALTFSYGADGPTERLLFSSG